MANWEETITTKTLAPVVGGKVQPAVSVLEVTRTETKVDTYTLEQLDLTIANIQKELANVQARLDYQLALRAELTK